MTCIYALCDPRTGEIRYVGKANNPAKRLKSHLADRQACRRVNWLKSLANDGVSPLLVSLEECQSDIWQERERHWITFLRDNGADLVNGTDGGDGTVGYRFPPEVRALLSAQKRGKVLSAKHKAKMALANLGKRATAETRGKMSAAHKGQVRSAEYRANISAGQVGKKMSPEARAKMRLAKLGTKHSSETRAKMSMAHKQRRKEIDHG